MSDQLISATRLTRSSNSFTARLVGFGGLRLLAGVVLIAGCGGDGSMMQATSDPIHFTVAASGDAPIDSTPDSNAGFVYFIGADAHGPGVFRAPAGGGAVSTVFTGAPLAKPVSLSLSSDDQKVYVADGSSGGVGGQVLVIQVSNGMLLSSFGGNMHPAGVEVAIQGGSDVVYFTGNDMDGKPGLFKTDGAAMASVVAKGDPFKVPGAVAVAGNGDIYVSDTPGAMGQGRVIKVSGGVATEYLTQLSLGNPAGLALSLDDKTLVVSAINASTGKDEVLIVDVGTKNVTHYSKGIEGNKDGGGVHRARKQDVFSWADLTAGGTGTVYKISFK